MRWLIAAVIIVMAVIIGTVTAVNRYKTIVPNDVLILLPSSVPLVEECYERGGRAVTMKTKKGYAAMAYCRTDVEER